MMGSPFWSRCLLLAVLLGVPGAAPFIATGIRPSPAAALAAVAIAPQQLQVPSPLQDAASRLSGAAVAWAGSLARTHALPADDLLLALVSPEAFWLLREWRRQTFGEQEAMRRVLDGARRDIREMRATDPALRGADVAVRSKGLWSTFVKAHVRQKAVHDVLAVRVVLKGSESEGRGDADVYGALDALRAVWPSVPGRFKDYVASPKANGYQGLHDTLQLPCGRAFEVQIRTEAMHREAEFGQAAHRKYKGAVAQLSERIVTGIQDGRGLAPRWPLQPTTALTLATQFAR